jgi:Rieske Fe-S protein
MAMGIGVPLIAGVALILLALITYVSPQYHASRQTDVGKSSDYAIGAPKYYETERFWVVKLAEGQIIALYDRDPISGCTVPWSPDLTVLGKTGWFRDACSDSTYDLSGACFYGPCLIGLNRIAVSTAANGDIIVDMSKDGGRGALRDDAAEPVTPPQ